MSQKAYEDACLRAELFGQPKPNKEEFLANHKHLDVVEFEDVDIKTAENTAMLDPETNEASGLSEFNSILTSTKTKMNKLKGVCDSLTGFFRLKLNAKDNLSYSSEPSYVGQSNYDKDYIPPQNKFDLDSTNSGLGPRDNEMTPSAGNPGKKKQQKIQDGGDINAGLSDLEQMQTIEDSVLLSKETANQITDQIKSRVSKLDDLITHQRDGACGSMRNMKSIKK